LLKEMLVSHGIFHLAFVLSIRLGAANGLGPPLPDRDRLRNHHDQGIARMIRQKKIEELTFEDCIEESRSLNDFVWDKADALAKVWPTLLRVHGHQDWKSSGGFAWQPREHTDTFS